MSLLEATLPNMLPFWGSRALQNKGLSTASFPDSCVTLAEGVNLSVPPFSHTELGVILRKRFPASRRPRPQEDGWVFVAWAPRLERC